MAWKSYRGHSQAGDTSPFAATVAALCLGLAFAAPWLLLVAGVISLWRWMVG
ncbi:MAG TPA: hypothetical protein VHN11_04400 [Xanthobacteraceae bacterium]|jgi:hypothetical protein|nr:hypothetical protein [Xanthobacteraceae bacterium]